MRENRTPEHAVLFVAPPEAVSVLRAVLAGLPTDFPAAILILLHKGTGQERPVADNLNVNSGLLVMPGMDGVALRNDRAYVMLPASNLAVGGDGALTPALDGETLLGSLAARYGRGAIAIALTALEAPEAEGFRRVREAGGHTIALDEADRLWADSSGPRVVPAEADELLPAALIGKRMIEMLAGAAV